MMRTLPCALAPTIMSREGAVFRTLGLGREWGDFGAARVVALATRALVHAYAGWGRPTSLTERFTAAYRARNALDLAEQCSRGAAPPPKGELAPLVFATAAEGDAVAQEIVRDAGRELGRDIAAGGVFRSGSPLLEAALLEQVMLVASGVRPVRLRAAPVIGSVLLATRAHGVGPDPAVRWRMSDQLARTRCCKPNRRGYPVDARPSQAYAPSPSRPTPGTGHPVVGQSSA